MVSDVLLCVTAMSVNGKTIALPAGSNSFAAIDSGTTGVVMPPQVLSEVFAAIPGSQQIETGQLAGHYSFRESQPMQHRKYIDNKLPAL